MATEAFIISEESQSPKRGVWVMLTTFATMIDQHLLALRFEITSSTGYRAVLPACVCDRTCCLRKGCSQCEHCHYGMHIERARNLADQVAKSYGSAERGKVDASVGRARDSAGFRVPNVPVREWAAGDWAQRMEKLVT